MINEFIKEDKKPKSKIEREENELWKVLADVCILIEEIKTEELEVTEDTILNIVNSLYKRLRFANNNININSKISTRRTPIRRNQKL